MIVGTIYDGSEAVTLDREATLPMREAKTWRQGQEERWKRGRDMVSIDGDSHLSKCRCGLVLSMS